jgi:hypothetical protein
VVSRHGGNNWVLMVSMAALFLGAAAVDLMTWSSNSALAGYYIVGSVLLGLGMTLWYWRNPPRLKGPLSAYLYTLAGAAVGGLFGAGIDPFHGRGAWLVLALAVVLFGWLERARVIVTAGLVGSVAAFLGLFIGAPVWGGGLQALTAAGFAVAAHRLHLLRHGRRKPRREVDIASLNLT